MPTAGCKHLIVSCFSEVCWVLVFVSGLFFPLFFFFFSPPWLSPKDFSFFPVVCWRCLFGSPVQALGASLACLPVKVGPFLVSERLRSPACDRAGLSSPSSRQSWHRSEQRQKEVLQGALHQGRLAWTEPDSYRWVMLNEL